ncbi:hypothetical protein N7466_002479 [Penicillium verhagenii]|uniref:uncharacterized protein n=1 Tax=Penicillium verhagenii TaxID=1562060 RepID=UPI002545B38D|nr:uncharacterized protein N7466_002479 [Penicillium verhagenii]KAJ5939345.1 hypothetical protein N7466_002479 [Penicillium verhagenii]
MASLLSVKAFAQALTADIQSLGLSAVIFGVLSHVFIFRTLPVEEYLKSLILLYAATAVAIGATYLSISDVSFLQALVRVAIITSSFNTGLAASIGVYRYFFHRLHRFPGPKLSKLSRFHDAYLAARNVQYNVEVERMHEKYGDFIRTALASYEPRIRLKADQLVSHMEKNLGQGIDITTWAMFFSFDIMGDVGFGKEFNNLSTGVEHPGIKAVHDHMAILGIGMHVPWVLFLATRIPGASASLAAFFQWCEDEVVQKQKVYYTPPIIFYFTWDAKEYPNDVVSWLLKAYVEKDISAPPTATALHEDSRAVLVAGSDTTASMLASTIYFLAKYPAVQAKLQQKLDEAIPGGSAEWSYEQTKSVAYLEDVITETLRLRPSVMVGASRVTPTEGLQVDEVHIPGDVNVFVPIQLLQTDERYYEQAKAFIPERWHEKKEMVCEDAPFFPFIMGPYICPGKNLALMSLRIAVSKLVQRYDIKFAPGETGIGYETETLDTFTAALPPLQIQFQRR